MHNNVPQPKYPNVIQSLVEVLTFLLPPDITINIHPTIPSPKLTFLCQSVMFVHLYVVANWNSSWSVMQIIISNRIHSQTTHNLCYMLNCTIIICITIMLRCRKWCSGFHLLGAVPMQLDNLSTSVSIKPCLCLSALLLGAKYTHTKHWMKSRMVSPYCLDEGGT